MELGEKKVDVRRASDGVWVSGIPGWGDLRLKVRGVTSSIYKNGLAKALRDLPLSEREADRSLSQERAERLVGEVLADVALLDWKNVSLNGEDVPHSKEKARELLTDPAFYQFRETVEIQCNVVGVIREGEDLDRLGK